MNKVNEVIKHEVAKLLPEAVNNQELGIVTVTRVNTSADLHYSTIFVSIISENEETSFGLIEKAAHKIQKILNDKLRMKYVPKISFKVDPAEKEVGRIEELIQEIRKNTH